MQIHGLQKLTLLDYPGHMAATVFTGGCNFRCPYCHNSELVLRPESVPMIPEAEVFAFLKARAKMLEAVCVTGGEPTLQKDLPEFLAKVRSLGYRVKLDSNGQAPSVLAGFLQNKLVDYVAMDIKNCRERYGETIGVPNFRTDAVEASVQLLMRSGIQYEFRTTVCKELHDTESIKRIGEWIAGARHYYLQPYRESDQVMHKGVFHAPEREELISWKELLAKTISAVDIRGLD
ncbi:MAG: anaerobic ribonucleoside-triphosphate reductase activating protein [Lachnospiraceae bacterium]|nr:anaerobic ribonucleoside-triphosphate reductase activating protein [Lachnospiraceae bacterium]